MRILIAYDASSGADEALEDLVRAGLPRRADALVVTAAPECGPESAPSSSAAAFGSGARRGRTHLAMEHAAVVAATGERRVRECFPRWDVGHRAVCGDGAFAVLETADRWKPDLVVAGAHAARPRHGLGVLGSTVRRVVAEAPCSVRVGRRRPGVAAGPLRILVGYDASSGADAAVASLLGRSWPAGSRSHVLVAVDPILVPVGAAPDEGGVPWRWLRERSGDAARKMAEAGLDSSSDVVTGDPRRTLLDAAARGGADVVFVGARGSGAGMPKLVGSAALAIAAGAPCSVEVVRPPTPA